MVDFHTATPSACPDGFLIGTHGSLITTITIIVIVIIIVTIMIAIMMITIIVTIIIIIITIIIIIVIKKGCLSWARSQLVFVIGSVTDHSVATYV